MRARSVPSPSRPPSSRAGKPERSPSTSPSRPVGEGYSSDEAKPRSNECSSPVGPVGEFSDSELAEEDGSAAVAPADTAQGASCAETPLRNPTTPSKNGDLALSPLIGPVGEGSSSSPIGPVGEGSSSSPIGPVGEGWTSDGESSRCSGAVGKGPNDFCDRSPSMTEERRPSQPRQCSPHTSARPTRPTLNGEQSPTPAPNPDRLVDDESAKTSGSQYRAPSPSEDMITAQSTIDWFEGELRLLQNAADVLAQTPAARISSRSEFWGPYNRLLGLQGIQHQQLWFDNTYQVD